MQWIWDPERTGGTMRCADYGMRTSLPRPAPEDNAARWEVCEDASVVQEAQQHCQQGNPQQLATFLNTKRFVPLGSTLGGSLRTL